MIRQLLILLCAAATLASCSTLTGKGNAIVANPADGKDATSTSTPAPAQKPSTDTAPRKPADTKSPATSRSESNVRLAQQLNGEWTIIEAGNHKIVRDEDMPYINFSAAEGKFYASNGCNILNGTFFTPGENEITFSSVLSTMKFCQGNDFQYQINEVIRDGSQVYAKFTKSGNETILHLSSAPDGKPLLTLRRHNLEQINGQWDVTRVDGKKTKVEEANIFFDINELTVHGNTGCNYFNGSIRIDPTIPNAISFSGMAVTGRLCENTEFEMAMLVALEEAHTYRISGRGASATLILLDNSGHDIMHLARHTAD